MSKLSPQVATVHQILTNLAKRGIAQITVENTSYDGREIQIDGQTLVNFGSGSYMGLETHPALKQGAMDALQRYGTQFPSSRAFIAIPLYEELEALLEQMFGYPAIAAASTSLAHISNIPVLVTKDDAVILDHQVHASVHNAVKMVKAMGTHVEMIRHSRMDLLEDRIKKLSQKYDRVYYMADGIYSMFGDGAPVEDLYALMDQYEQFHLYIDDAHGMGWTGRNGSGYVLQRIPFHRKMILVTSLNKSFAAGGGATICPDMQTKELIRRTGSTLIFSGPIQPPLLGAAVASAKFHLSDECPVRQRALSDRLEYFVNLAKRHDLLLVNEDRTPIFFLAVGKPDIGYKLCRRMMDLGYYMNIAVYPAVPYKNTGLRITITNHLGFEDIRRMLVLLSIEFERTLREENYTREEIYQAFRIKKGVTEFVYAE